MPSSSRNRRRKMRQQLEKAEGTARTMTPNAVVEATNMTSKSDKDTPPEGDSAGEQVAVVECPKKPEPPSVRRSLTEWKIRIREAFLRQRSSEWSGADIQEQSQAANFTPGVRPPDFHRSKPLPVWTREYRYHRNELEDLRVFLPDASPFCLPYVRDTLSSYERVDDWFKDVQHECLKLTRWERPFRTALLLMVSMWAIWMGYFLQLVLAPLIFHLIRQSFGERNSTGSNQNNPSNSCCRGVCILTYIPKIMQLDVRVSKTFEDISTVYDKTESLFSWKKASTSVFLLLVLLALTILAFWKGQEVAVQIMVTAILLKMFIVDEMFRRSPHLAARYDLIGRAWDQLPVRPQEIPQRRKNRG